ncbi:MAG: Na+/H+ antiporter subunit B [Ignavibacterium sp.]|nr:Na+/H+ antiporter subunit B [Ignavibacterium sp.]
MFSVILSTASKYLLPLLLIFSFFLLLRGHNEPGGGFVGGLVAAAAYALYFIGNGVGEAEKLLKVEPIKLIAVGLLIALLSTIPSLFVGKDFMTGIWLKNNFPVVGKVGTPFIFDVGVYLLVLGISLKIIFSLAEEDK